MRSFLARKARDLPSSGHHQLYSGATLQAVADYSLGSERVVARGDSLGRLCRKSSRRKELVLGVSAHLAWPATVDKESLLLGEYTWLSLALGASQQKGTAGHSSGNDRCPLLLWQTDGHALPSLPGPKLTSPNPNVSSQHLPDSRDRRAASTAIPNGGNSLR